jgi:uncharacterized membrane protein
MGDWFDNYEMIATIISVVILISILVPIILKESFSNSNLADQMGGFHISQEDYHYY